MTKGKLDECPKCKKQNREKYFIDRLNSKYKNEFEVIHYINYDKKVTLRHKACGSILEVYPSNLFNGSFPCKKCLKDHKNKEKKLKYEKKINEIYKGKFSFIGDYNGIKTKTKFHCNSCDTSFDETPDIMLQKRKKCPNCR